MSASGISGASRAREVSSFVALASSARAFERSPEITISTRPGGHAVRKVLSELLPERGRELLRGLLEPAPKLVRRRVLGCLGHGRDERGHPRALSRRDSHPREVQ